MLNPMPTPLKLCAHLGYQFGELPPMERFSAAARAGFEAVEWPALYQYPAEQLRAPIAQHRLTWVHVTLPTGNAAAGEKGLAALPGRQDEFAEGLRKAIEYALVLDARWIHPMSGVVPAWTAEVRRTYVDNLRLTLTEARKHSLGVLVEVINPAEVAGYAMGSYELADAMFQEVASDGTPSLLLDAYHGQMLTGDLIGLAKQWAGRIAHVQVADVPGRHEPGTGTLDFDAFFQQLVDGGYTGWVGCEYKPLTTTPDGLEHLAPYLNSPK
jgi:hydroxypyruvate isomerase